MTRRPGDAHNLKNILTDFDHICIRELLALKRVGPIRGSTTANVVLVPEGSGDQDLCIYLLSDAYLGLDQQYDMHPHVEEEEGAGEGDELIYYSDEERPWEEQVEDSYPSK